MNIIGFNQGQIGDLAMNIICCKSLKNKYPDCKITFSINKKYESIIPIFFLNLKDKAIMIFIIFHLMRFLVFF